MSPEHRSFPRDLQYIKFSLYGALKNLKFFEPFIILYFRQVGLTFLQIGTLFAVREICTNLFEIPTGVIADSYGRRNSMVLSFFAYILSFLLFAFVPSFGIFIAAMVFFAVGEAFRTGTHKAMILEYLRIRNLLKFKVDYYGHTRAWSQIGAAVSSLLAAALVFYSGSFRIIFIASIVPYLIDALLILSYPKELDGEIRRGEPGSSVGKRILFRLKDTLSGFGAMFRSADIFRAILNGSLFDGVFKTAKEYLQPILRQYALLIPILLSLEQEKRTALIVGIVYFLLYLLTSFSARRSGTLIRKLPLTTALNAMYGIGIIILAATGTAVLSGSYRAGILLFIVYYMAENVKRPMNVGFFSELVESRFMATGLSVESQATTIVMAVLAPLIGLVADSFGVSWGLLAMAALLILAFPGAWVRKKVPAEPA